MNLGISGNHVGIVEAAFAVEVCHTSIKTTNIIGDKSHHDDFVDVPSVFCAVSEWRYASVFQRLSGGKQLFPSLGNFDAIGFKEVLVVVNAVRNSSDGDCECFTFSGCPRSDCASGNILCQTGEVCERGNVASIKEF